MSAHLITLKCGLSDPGSRPDTGLQLRDVLTGQMPRLWAGAKTNLRLLMQNPVTGEALSVTGWAEVTFRLLGENRTTLYVERDIPLAALTGVAPRETTVALTTAETTLAPGLYWISVFATMSAGGILPLAAGPLNVLDGGMLTTTAAAPADPPVYTQAQVDALFAALVQFAISGNTLTVTYGGSTWTVAMTPSGGSGTGGVSALNSNGRLTQSGTTWTWPMARTGSGSGETLVVTNSNAILTTGGSVYTWPVTPITYLPGAPLAQVVNSNLIITIGGNSYSSTCTRV